MSACQHLFEAWPSMNTNWRFMIDTAQQAYRVREEISIDEMYYILIIYNL